MRLRIRASEPASLSSFGLASLTLLAAMFLVLTATRTPGSGGVRSPVVQHGIEVGRGGPRVILSKRADGGTTYRLEDGSRERRTFVALDGLREAVRQLVDSNAVQNLALAAHGDSTFDEIDRTLQALREAGVENVSLLVEPRRGAS